MSEPERRVSLRKRGVAAMYDIDDRIDELHKKQKVPRLKCKQSGGFADQDADRRKRQCSRRGPNHGLSAIGILRYMYLGANYFMEPPRKRSNL